ncbi:MAG: AraC family transcriptional regulator [Hyphomicrobiales bacterium]|nr:AraC family transcriptional regulator [Hyphomicrobiales bacterium]
MNTITSHPAGEPRLVVMAAFPGGNLIDIAGPLQAFDTAHQMRPAGSPGYHIRTVSETGGQIVTAPGLAIATEPLSALADARIDTLIIPGGLPRSEPFGVDGLVAWLAQNARMARRLCSVCTGAFLLADAGLLAGKRCTTHWSRADELRARHPGLDIDAQSIFIRDGDTWTSGGVTAGIDLALALIEADLGHETAIATARQLVMFVKRPGGQAQFSAPLALQASRHATFAPLHGWIAEHLDTDLRVERLAAEAGMSPRTFARTYAAEIGRTPAKSVELIRLEAACRALEQTQLPLKRIAASVGLGTEQNLRRVIQRQFGISPADYRARFARTAGSMQHDQP